MNREGIANIDFLKASFKSPLFYVLSSTKNPGTGDTISLVSDPEQFLTVIMQGDVTGDGAIDGSDALAVINYFLKGTEFTAPFAAGDVNVDGTIDGSDALAVINYFLKGTEF